MTTPRLITGPDDPALKDYLDVPRLVAEDMEPVFVVGAMRSGVGGLARALHAGADLAGLPGGGLLPVAQKILDEVAWHYSTLAPKYVTDTAGNLIANTSRDVVESQVTNWILATYAKEQPGSRFVEANVEGSRGAPLTRSLPMVAQLFPKARFIFVARRAIECVHSCFERSPGTPIQHFAWIWQDTIDAWSKVRAELGDRAIEVRQHEMALDPTGLASRLQQFLELPDAAQAGLAKALQSERSGQDHFAADWMALDLDAMPWQPHQKSQVRDLCETMMRAADFQIEGGPIAKPQPAALFAPASAKAYETRGIASPDHFRFEEEATLHFAPSGAGAGPAEFRYLKAFLAGGLRFEAEVTVPEASASAVVCRVRIETHDKREPVRRLQRVVEPGQVVDWSDSIEALAPGWYDVIVAVMLPESATTDTGATSTWRHAAFHPVVG